MANKLSQASEMCNSEEEEFNSVKQLEYEKRNENNQRNKDVTFQLPAVVKETPHRETILRICSTPENNFMLMGQDGLVSFWSSDINLKKSRSLFENTKLGNKKFKWISDFILLNQYNKLIIGTCDREMRFYELSNFEPYCQIVGLESMPLHLDHSFTENDECVILFGDEQGCVNIFLISLMGETLRSWTKCPALDGIPTINIEKIIDTGHVSYIRWKVHTDWLTEIKYIDSMRAVISSCNDHSTALVIGCLRGTKTIEQRMIEMKDDVSCKSRHPQAEVTAAERRLSCDETVFKIPKGAKTFDFCKEKTLVVTGGLDRIIRLWNPYLPGWPTGLLRGHDAPLAFLKFAVEDNRIFSVSTDNTTKVWDIEDQTCLVTINPQTIQLSGELSACYYSKDLRALCIATNSLALLQLTDRKEQCVSKSMSHKEKVLCCDYSSSCRRVISCSEGSVMKVWDLDTGRLVSEFTGAHGEAAITCVAFSNTETRLITGGRDGCVKKWDYKRGQCVKTLTHAEGTADVNHCIYAEIYKNRFIISVGSDRRINIFSDPEDNLCGPQYPLLHWTDDTNNGHKDEVLSVALCPPNLLASSSYDGEIIVWNFVSGLIFYRLHPTTTSSRVHQAASDEDLTINKVLFITSRAASRKTSGSLVASGPRGHIHFWNVFSGGELWAHFQCVNFGDWSKETCPRFFSAQELISKRSDSEATLSNMDIGEDGSLLCAADHLGSVYIWHILHYALHEPETCPPKLLACWRAHGCNITSIRLVEEQFLLTCSSDCTVKLWSVEGEYIGFFGQKELWNVHNRDSWQRLLRPEDLSTGERTEKQLAIDRESKQGLKCENATSESVHVKNKAEEALILLTAKCHEITKELQQLDSTVKNRLIQQKLKRTEKQKMYGRLAAYQSLPYHELTHISMNIHVPSPAAELKDPFDIAPTTKTAALS